MGPQKCDLKISVSCQLAWFSFVVVFTLFKCSHNTGCYYNEERGTGEPLGGTPSSNGLYRTGAFSGFRFRKG